VAGGGAQRARADAVAAEHELIDLYLAKGRTEPAIQHLRDLRERGDSLAAGKLDKMDYDDAVQLLQQGKKVAAIARLQQLRFRGYKPATDLLDRLDP